MKGQRAQNHHQLQLVWSKPTAHDESVLEESLTELVRDLVQIRSQGGLDNQLTAITFLSDWLHRSGVSSETIRSGKRTKAKDLGLLASVGSGRGPFYLITACLDTAVFGDESSWQGSPTSGYVDQNGRLHGRGSADSKAAISIFAHLVAKFSKADLKGTLVFLADSDEHSGRFGAVRTLVEHYYRDHHFQGAYIGYPGNDRIMVGARGFFRAEVTFAGREQHSGAKASAGRNPILDASKFVDDLSSAHLPKEPDPSFGADPKISIVGMRGGNRGYSVTPHSCTVKIDVRLTPHFGGAEAKEFIDSIIKISIDRGADVKVKRIKGWPSYKLQSRSKLVEALKPHAEAEFGMPIGLAVSGPSNVGNYLAAHGIPATCGFGVAYGNIHAPNEYIELDTLKSVYRAYEAALAKLLL